MLAACSQVSFTWNLSVVQVEPSAKWKPFKSLHSTHPNWSQFLIEIWIKRKNFPKIGYKMKISHDWFMSISKEFVRERMGKRHFSEEWSRRGKKGRDKTCFDVQLGSFQTFTAQEIEWNSFYLLSLKTQKKFFNQFCAKRKKRNLNESNLHLEGQNSILVPIKVFLSSRFYAWNTFAASKVIDNLLPFGGCAHRKVIIMDTPGSVRWVITCCYHLLCFALWFSNPRLREVWKSLKLQF